MPTRRSLRSLLLVAMALLFVASVPWYRPGEAVPALIGGLPDWVAVALACYAAVAVLNALAWLLTEIEDPPEAKAAEGDRGARV